MKDEAAAYLDNLVTPECTPYCTVRTTPPGGVLPNLNSYAGLPDPGFKIEPEPFFCPAPDRAPDRAPAPTPTPTLL